MLEYVFFHALPCERFVEFLRRQGLDPVVESDGETWEVGLPEALPERMEAAIEARYDQLLELNRQLHDQEAGGEEFHAAGVVVKLAAGDTVYAQVPPALLGRILSVLTPEEFGEVVNAIVDAVESPDGRTLCQRMRAEAETGPS